MLTFGPSAVQPDKKLPRGHRSRYLSPLAIIAAAGFGLLPACDTGGGDQGARIGGSSKLQKTTLPTLQVRLPPSPSFKKIHAPELYPDNTLSVYGARKKIKALNNKEIRVKGFLLEIYKCPECPKGAKCKTCDAPHFYLSDRKTGAKDKALLVSDYPERDAKTNKKIKLEEGVRYIVTGLFAKRSGTGFSSADGILVFREIAPIEEIAK
ncbi:MAG: hypothetical protein KAI47_18325 [Deltaproteobacteria bacterium]|nr:hypothetical protein [Deltaproteobacteria bacterium]